MQKQDSQQKVCLAGRTALSTQKKTPNYSLTWPACVVPIFSRYFLGCCLSQTLDCIADKGRSHNIYDAVVVDEDWVMQAAVVGPRN